jgi:hypothetical protein
MALMEFYLYPPKYLSSAAVATPVRGADDLYHTSNPELSSEKQALNYVRARQQAPDSKSTGFIAVSSA